MQQILENIALKIIELHGFLNFGFLLICLIIGIILLIKAGDSLSDASATLAKFLGVPPILIGLTVVSIATSAPELFTTISAVTSNAKGLILGNIIGSNIANIGLILGVTLVIKPIHLTKTVPTFQKVTLLLVTLGFSGYLYFSPAHAITWQCGSILLGFLTSYLIFLSYETIKERKLVQVPPLTNTESNIGQNHQWISLGLIIGSSFGLWLGSETLVFGSKSGIKDDLDVIDPESDTMWVVDLCQFRVDPKLIHELLEKGVMVMLTGSKFFQAPPFCAAMLVPRKWSEKLSDLDASIIKPYGKLFSAYDVPFFMQNMRDQLPARENKALRLRWEIALDEMEAYHYWSTKETDDIITRWATGVMSRLETSNYFKLMPDQLKTNMSIISFQVWVGDNALDNAQLKDLFKAITTSTHEGFVGGFNKVFFGQPVQYGAKSFIRLAIGAYTVRAFLEKDAVDLHNDYRVIEIIEEYAQQMFG